MACGDDGATAVQDAPPADSVDAPAGQCLPQGAVGAFYRRTGNPRIIAGTHTFNDGKLDTAIADPNLLWDEGSNLWHLYYQSPHGTTFNPPGPMVIRHATSPDLTTWTFQDAPAFTVSASGWDATHAETPTVVYNPAAAADKKFVLMYSGAEHMFPVGCVNTECAFPDYAIGAAFSADGATFTRAGTDGKVLDASAVYPASPDGIVADPELVVVGGTYHLFFSSYGCSGANCSTVDAYGIAHATSTDAITWTIVEAPVLSLLSSSSVKSSGYSQPSAIYDDVHCRWELWMADQTAVEVQMQPVNFNNMAGVKHATSQNGTSWTIDPSRDLTWDMTAAGEHMGLLTGADVAQKGTGRYMVYVGFDNQNVPADSNLPTRESPFFAPGVMTLNLATRDAAP